MLRSLKVARPVESLVRVVVPLSEPVPVLKLMTTATPDTSFPKVSVTWTFTEGAMATPAVASVGCCEKANWLAAAGEMVKGLLRAELKPELEAVKFLEPLRLTLRSLNVARPA